MKLGKFELALTGLALAAVCFSAGYFTGRDSAGGVNITVNEAPVLAAPVETDGEGLVDLNSAGRWELMSLPGVGEALADRILAYREEKGYFRSIEEIMSVRGIGESLFDKISDLITVSLPG